MSFSEHRFEQLKGFPVEASCRSIASVSSKMDQQGGNKSRWTELEVFETKQGKYICVTRGCSSLSGETTRQQVVVRNTLQEVCGGFTSGWLSQKMLKELPLDPVQRIE